MSNVYYLLNMMPHNNPVLVVEMLNLIEQPSLLIAERPSRHKTR